MPNRMRIITPPEWREWADALTGMGRDMGRFAVEWELATERFYDATQAVVHIITGRLKASGAFEVDLQGARIVGTVGYTVPYASSEADRGGDHDYLGRGWELSQAGYDAAMGRIWLRRFRR